MSTSVRDGSEIDTFVEPRQSAFITCPADDVAFGGARGGGGRARARAAAAASKESWPVQVAAVKQRLLTTRMQQIILKDGNRVAAPWQFRNCGMGGRHTEKEYPESNVSMQEAMFLILGTPSYQEAQELTVRLQTRLKEIIESAEGCRVMGIGLEGGLAPYIEKDTYPLPEVRLWAMMKRAIAECGCRPGVDVAIALDPAMSELELAYRAEFNLPDSVGTYLFWRDKAKTVLDRDGVLDLYSAAIEREEIPILSIEDGFSEHDRAAPPCSGCSSRGAWCSPGGCAARSPGPRPPASWRR